MLLRVAVLTRKHRIHSATLSINPSSLSAGVYPVSVEVSDGRSTTTASVELTARAAIPAAAANAEDPGTACGAAGGGRGHVRPTGDNAPPPPTDAAGGIVDGGTIGRGLAANFDPYAALADNDTYPFLAAAGDLIVIGPTGTNVADIWMFRRRADSEPEVRGYQP